MGVVAQLATEAEALSGVPTNEYAIPDADLRMIHRMQILLGVSAFMLRRLEEQYNELETLIRNPPRIIDLGPPDGSVDFGPSGGVRYRSKP